jgi:hypothetical protein
MRASIRLNTPSLQANGTQFKDNCVTTSQAQVSYYISAEGVSSVANLLVMYN